MLARDTSIEQSSRTKIIKHNLVPSYGENYDLGYVGFTFNASNIISQGIAYFTGLGRMSDIRVSHALLVSGKDECIEAHVEGGVRRASLKKYFDDEHSDVFFRKPLGLTQDIALKLIARAENEIGRQYDPQLILAHALAGTMLGHYLDKVSGGKVEQALARIMNTKNRWICSELVAYCLDQPPYEDRGILSSPWEAICPQELFEDPLGQLFEPWNDFRIIH